LAGFLAGAAAFFTAGFLAAVFFVVSILGSRLPPSQTLHFSQQAVKYLHSPSSLNHLDQHHNDGDDQQDVNDSTQRVATDQSQQPQN
jgi:hypothetical protein